MICGTLIRLTLHVRSSNKVAAYQRVEYYFFVIFMTPYQLISNMREHRYQHEINKNEN